MYKILGYLPLVYSFVAFLVVVLYASQGSRNTRGHDQRMSTILSCWVYGLGFTRIRVSCNALVLEPYLLVLAFVKGLNVNVFYRPNCETTLSPPLGVFGHKRW
jgi:hypothetical protein